MYALTTKQGRSGTVFAGVWSWFVSVFDPTGALYGVSAGGCAVPLPGFLWKIQMRGGIAMRVVVVKSPKLVGGILRRLFGIQKVTNIT